MNSGIIVYSFSSIDWVKSILDSDFSQSLLPGTRDERSTPPHSLSLSLPSLRFIQTFDILCWTLLGSFTGQSVSILMHVRVVPNPRPLLFTDSIYRFVTQTLCESQGSWSPVTFSWHDWTYEFFLWCRRLSHTPDSPDTNSHIFVWFLI